MNSLNRSVHPQLKRRLIQELTIVRERFGDSFRLQRPVGQSDNCVELRLEGECPIEGQRVLVRVCYPAIYPLVPPELWLQLVVDPRCPHLLAREGLWLKICWLDGNYGNSPRRRWDPNRHTAATAILAAQRWMAAMLVWQQCGNWPVADAWE